MGEGEADKEIQSIFNHLRASNGIAPCTEREEETKFNTRYKHNTDHVLRQDTT